VSSKTAQKHLWTANCAELFQNHNFSTAFSPFPQPFSPKTIPL
jgi:hypothetical protein